MAAPELHPPGRRGPRAGRWGAVAVHPELSCQDTNSLCSVQASTNSFFIVPCSTAKQLRGTSRLPWEGRSSAWIPKR